MKDTNDSYAVKTLEAWYQAQLGEFKEQCVSNKFKDSGHGSASVQLETSKYIIDVSAWNHASCLDIQILEIESEESTFPTVGDCETKIIFEKHLESFMRWFNNESNEKA
ncbi:MAG: hypothetical protein V3V12_08860 [Gammaproteobacteria bacterium]